MAAWSTTAVAESNFSGAFMWLLVLAGASKGDRSRTRP
jgi:hypothetical protein